MREHMKRYRLGATVFGALLIFGCSSGTEESQKPAADLSSTAVANSEQVVERAEWSTVLEAEGLSGTFVLKRLGSSQTHVLDHDRASTAMTPASTFKILNSLIILETGVLPDVETEVPWDGIDREIAAWNMDHSLRSGIEVSAVWMYQEMARQIGEERMQQWVEDTGYGNSDTGGEVDSFWLDGDLRISALEQVDFLSRLVRGELPFDDATVASVREILVRESGSDWAWSYKTGTSRTADPDLGWLVGFTENGEDVWVFALNLDMEPARGDSADLDPRARQKIVRKILEAEGALPIT